MDPILQKFKNVFLEEAQEILNSYESDLLGLEQDSFNKELVESSFRSMHTLKGISGMYGFSYINELTHKLEHIFQAVRDKQQVFTKEIFETTFAAIDHIRKLLFDEELADESLRMAHNELLENIGRFCISESATGSAEPESAAPENSKQIWHIKLTTSEKQFFRKINFLNIFRDLAEIGTFIIEHLKKSDEWNITLLTSATEDEVKGIFMFIEDDCSFSLAGNLNESDIEGIEKGELLRSENEISILEAVSMANSKTKEEKKPDKNTSVAAINDKKRISVTHEKLDYLMFLVSELVTVNSQIAISLKQMDFEFLESAVEKLNNLSKNFRDNALELRLVPINDLVLRFQRLIRDLSKQLGKHIDFQVHGAETELDKSTIEQLFDPLMHIIRNSIDHGIETPEERRKIGKPETGIIKLSAYHSGGKIVLKIEDDGNGVDLEKVRNKAIKLGLIGAEEQVSKKQLLDMIFIPGFSTAQSLTSVSGRGVGMDVVRKKIQELRGEVSVESSEKSGTTFNLILHQSVSILDTLLFKVGESFFIIPFAETVICSEINLSDLIYRQRTRTIPYEDHLIEYFDLRETLNIKGEYPKDVKVIVFRTDSQIAAILADYIVGEYQAVLKPMGNFLNHNNFLEAVSQLGDGTMAFMIDTRELIKAEKDQKVNC